MQTSIQDVKHVEDLNSLIAPLSSFPFRDKILGKTFVEFECPFTQNPMPRHCETI